MVALLAPAACPHHTVASVACVTCGTYGPGCPGCGLCRACLQKHIFETTPPPVPESPAGDDGMVGGLR